MVRERRDDLAFRADTWLLRSWQIQAGLPGHETHMQFLFDDYRATGSVTIPYFVGLIQFCSEVDAVLACSPDALLKIGVIDGMRWLGFRSPDWSEQP
jgi:hypothetical protein